MQKFCNGRATLYCGDNRVVLKDIPDNTFDSIVTDPPYALNFMGKGWDTGSVTNDPEFWRECLRVLKPGGHLAAFGGTRTYHRMTCAIEDAGFEIRDSLMWIYGSGFPKSLDVSKAIDKAAGFTGLKTEGATGKGTKTVSAYGDGLNVNFASRPAYISECDVAREWEGWGTALKPAFEPIVLARKPLSEKTVAANVLRWGTGALNIDACRVSTEMNDDIHVKNPHTINKGSNDIYGAFRKDGSCPAYDPTKGRWPANVVHDGSDEVVESFPNNKDGLAVQRNRDGEIHNQVYGSYRKPKGVDVGYGGSGSVARFFYSAKDTKTKGRWPANVVHDGSDEVIESFPIKDSSRASGNPNNPIHGVNVSGTSYEWGEVGRESNDYRDKGSAARFFYSSKASKADRAGSKHPTVKPIALMEWLIKLITPPDGHVLDPFAGSGTTGQAAINCDFSVSLIELETEYQKDIESRMSSISTLEFEE